MKKFLAYLLFSFLIASLFACSSNDNTTAPPQTPNISLWQVRADAGNATVTLDWQMLADATSYNIYYISYADNPGSTVIKASGTKVTGLIGPRYTVTGLTNNTKYWWFALSAVNANGESDLSSIIWAVPNDPPPPPAPTNIRANAGNKKVTVTWNTVTASPAVASYNLQSWDTLSLGRMSIITIPAIPGQTTSSYDVNIPLIWNVGTATETTAELANGTPYIFLLTAETDESANSVTVSATPGTESDTTVPSIAAVKSITATVTAGTSNKVTITWVALDTATPYTSYNLYYYPTIAGSPTTRIPEFVNGHFVSWPTLKDGTSYSFYLTAVTSSSASFEVMATPNTTLPPEPPVLTTATAGDGKVTLVWMAPTTGIAPASYNIYWSTLANVTKTTGAATKGLSATSPLTATATLANGTTYYFVVTSVNANGESMESNELPATPVAPTTLSGSSVSGVTIDYGSIVVSAH